MQIGSNPGGCWHYQRGLPGSLHFLAIWLLLIKPFIYLLLLFWEMTTHCQSLRKQGNAQTHRQAYTLLAKLATKPYNYANTPKCGRMFFLFTLQSQIRGGSGSGSHVISTCQYPALLSFAGIRLEKARTESKQPKELTALRIATASCCSHVG